MASLQQTRAWFADGLTCALAWQVVLVPVFVVLWFSTARWAPVSAALVFIAAAITDWLDGYLARLVRYAATPRQLVSCFV